MALKLQRQSQDIAIISANAKPFNNYNYCKYKAMVIPTAITQPINGYTHCIYKANK